MIAKRTYIGVVIGQDELQPQPQPQPPSQSQPQPQPQSHGHRQLTLSVEEGATALSILQSHANGAKAHVTFAVDFASDAAVGGSQGGSGSSEFEPEIDEAEEYEPPSEERVIEINDDVSEAEIASNPEFFSSNPVKTRDRYVKIRNYILRCWQRQRPKYVSKTSVRPGLKDCGDVNAIGRVHGFLERYGAINFGCAAAARPVKRRPPSKSTPSVAQIEAYQAATTAATLQALQLAFVPNPTAPNASDMYVVVI